MKNMESYNTKHILPRRPSTKQGLPLLPLQQISTKFLSYIFPSTHLTLIFVFTLNPPLMILSLY